MRVLILGLNYLPETTSIGPYTADLAECLARRGHSVQVVTGFPMAPQWSIPAPYRSKLFMAETVRGIPVTRCFLFVPRNPTSAKMRVLFDSSFAASSLLASAAAGPVDVVVAVSPPLQVGLTASLICKWRRARLFLHVQDIVPDAAVAVGALAEGSLPVRIARALERFVYARADSIGVISDGFTRNLRAKGVPAGKIALLPNWVDTDEIRPTPCAPSFREVHGIPADAFVVMYSGSLASKQGLETLIDAAALLAGDPRATVCVIGDGPRAPALRRRAKDLRLKNVRFLPLQPRASLAGQLAAADLLVITQVAGVRDIVLPGKLGYYLAAGRPILAAVHPDSETARLLKRADAGIVTAPEDAAGMASAIRSLMQAPQDAERLGRNGRLYAESNMSKTRGLIRFAEHLERLVMCG
ncbi:MAG TPA: WcaI family glycosyltransferase [Chloroflexota bacterium]|nr:WcaI family glycosyltransferase [Chloroflexota bacterium]